MILLNPYDLPKIKTGYDLYRFYVDLVNKFKTNAPIISQDGYTVNLKFIKTDNKQFEILGDHGKSNVIDIHGFDYSDLNKRFINNKYSIKAYKALFNIFSNASINIYSILKKLKLFNSNTILKCKFVPNNTIIVEDVLKYDIKKNERNFTSISFDKSLLAELTQTLQPYAANINFEIIAPIETRLLGQNIGGYIFDRILNTPYTIAIKPNFAITKTLKNWLRGCRNPIRKKINLNDKKISIFNKTIYFKMLNNIPLSDIIGIKNLYNHKKDLINAFVIQLSNQAFGQTLIEYLSSPIDNLPITHIQYKDIQILGDSVIDKFKHMDEDEQVVTSYISNPPHKTSDWGTQVPMVESWDLEIEPNHKLFVNYIVSPRPFLKNDYEIYRQISENFLNPIVTIVVPTEDEILFNKIKQTILEYGIPEELIEQHSNKIIPHDEVMGNSDLDALVYVITDDSKKHLKYIKGYLKNYINVGKLLPYHKHAYYFINKTPDLNLLGYTKLKNYEDYIKQYKVSTDADRNKLLEAMYGNLNLKKIFDSFLK